MVQEPLFPAEWGGYRLQESVMSLFLVLLCPKQRRMKASQYCQGPEGLV
jgi:hypothetical protein